ncbi:Shikimate dehydrogenase [Desulfurobacterium thermolithotrophum DSM 11699]|uniref:Shikimate dehydrogenase (NADP(+)) n=1 Tax=Desulfurobacterium thermolithotrophum (strain DSM 11699 / BSA) TaxID=868864 RepID=F0S2F1_DESTD|nr:shikimate dehydrogenase [Desulfurobacterium thermolithotrophum]ADY74166.1 Shikimate dehydrogenase [Desulfurobacterium thermolithotrophum DSM 11699]
MKLTGKTFVYGIIGYPVKHSLSPLMQTAAFKALGIDAVYVPFEVEPENLGEAVRGLRALNVKGFNVTVPFKENVIEYLDFVDEDAEFLGAVNTVKIEDGKLTGYNTDADGFLKSLIEEGVELKGKKITMFGAGGAARAVGYAVLKGGAKFLNIVNRNFSKGKIVGELLGKRGNVLVFPLREDSVATLLKDTDIIINTTSVGMKPDDPLLFDYSLIPEGITVVDIIYNPAETLLLKAAKEKGCKIVNGLGMLIYQGAIAFEIWTEKKAPVEVMRRVLEEEIYG